MWPCGCRGVAILCSLLKQGLTEEQLMSSGGGVASNVETLRCMVGMYLDVIHTYIQEKST